MTYGVSYGTEETTMPTPTEKDDRRREDLLLQQRWHGWASPVGLGLGLLCIGGFFGLLAHGLAVMASI